MGTFAAGGRQIIVRMANVERALSKPAVTKRLTAAGVAAKKAAAPVPAQDLGGDNAFSGWKRGKPIPLQVKFQQHRSGLGLTFHREGRSAGQWRVAEDGRQHNSLFAGPGIHQRKGHTNRTKTGKISMRRPTKVRRYNGYAAGKGTWSKAAKVLAATSTEVFEESTAADVAAAFKGKR